MINKIFNWIFSSFFRTFGRILVYILVALAIMFLLNGKVNAETLADFTNARYRVYTGQSASGTLLYDNGNNGTVSGTFVNIPSSNAYGTTFSFYNIVNASDALDSGITESFVMSLQMCSSTSAVILDEYSGIGNITRTSGAELLYGTSSTYQNCNVAGTAGYLQTYFVKYDTTTYNASGDFAFENKFYFVTYRSWGYEINFNITSVVVENSTAALLSQIDELKQNQTIINGNITLNNSIQQQISSQQDTNNKLDEQIQQNKEQHDETMNYLTDDTVPESDISALGNVQGLLPPGPLDSLLNIPFKFLSIITSSMSGSCVPLSGTFVFDSTLTLPCFSEMIYDDVPEYLMFFINLIPAAFILIKYLKHLYKKVDRAVSMNTTADDEWGVL